MKNNCILLTIDSPIHCCVCPKPGAGFHSTYVVVYPKPGAGFHSTYVVVYPKPGPGFHSTYVVVYPKPGPGFHSTYVVVYLMCIDLREVVVHFVDIGGICLPSLLKLGFLINFH
jgi:hypothetical protein